MRLQILLIDDDEDIRDLYKELFEDSGYEVDIAEDGEIGLAKIQSATYNLILLDIMMPGMDGLILLRKLQHNMPKCPIILLTNLDHDPIRQEGLSLGATDYLIKANYTPPALLEKIKSYLALPPRQHTLTN